MGEGQDRGNVPVDTPSTSKVKSRTNRGKVRTESVNKEEQVSKQSHLEVEHSLAF